MNLLPLLLTFFISLTAHAGEYRDAARRFTITFPDGWTVVPQIEVDAFDQAIGSRVPDRDFRFIAAFTKDPARPFEPPYVVAQETVARLTGHYADIERQLGAADPDAAVAEAARSNPDVLNSAAASRVIVDRARNRMVFNVSLTDARGAAVRGLCTGHFGADAVIQLNAYAPADHFKAYQPVFNAFNDGFRFDPGAAFVPDSTGSSLALRIPTFILLACALIAAGAWIRKRFFKSAEPA